MVPQVCSTPSPDWPESGPCPCFPSQCGAVFHSPIVSAADRIPAALHHYADRRNTSRRQPTRLFPAGNGAVVGRRQLPSAASRIWRAPAFTEIHRVDVDRQQALGSQGSTRTASSRPSEMDAHACGAHGPGDDASRSADDRLHPSSSPTWTRTKNLPVNSRLLCQLSYRGSQVAVARISLALATAQEYTTPAGRREGVSGGLAGVPCTSIEPDKYR